MRAVELTTEYLPRRASLGDPLTSQQREEAMLRMLCGVPIPKCIHVRLQGAAVAVVAPELAYCHDCHDLFDSWSSRNAAA